MVQPNDNPDRNGVNIILCPHLNEATKPPFTPQGTEWFIDLTPTDRFCMCRYCAAKVEGAAASTILNRAVTNGVRNAGLRN